MANVLMNVRDGTKEGMLDLLGDAYTEDGNAQGGAGFFQFPNDGKTVVLIYAGGAGGETWTVTPVLDKFGRTEVVVPFNIAVLTLDIARFGPFDPQLWNDVNGYVNFAPAGGGDVLDQLLAIRISKPT